MCLKCTHLGSDDDGSDYPRSWPICFKERPEQNLKGFPFKRPPKTCKKVFMVNKLELPGIDRLFITDEILCQFLCKEATKDWHTRKCYKDRHTCDVRRYIAGRTDIPVLTEESIRNALVGRFPGFEFAEWSICSKCLGEGNYKTDTGYSLCEKCDGIGRFPKRRRHAKGLKAYTCGNCESYKDKLYENGQLLGKCKIYAGEIISRDDKACVSFGEKIKPTPKQTERVKKIMDYLGKDVVREYLIKHFPGGSLDDLTKEQAQKIITGLDSRIPKKPIFGVVGRDVRPVRG